MKTYVLYHANCPDGCGAALAAYLKLGQEAEYIPVNYGNPPPAIIPGSKVFIVDFSYPRETLINIRDVNEVQVIDHHATAQKDLEGLNYARFDMTKSGAVLTWEYFHPDEPVPQFFLYLQDRDLWQWKLPLSREVSYGLRAEPFDFIRWQALLLPQSLTVLANDGAAMLKLVNQQVEIMAKNHRWVIFWKEPGPLIKNPDLYTAFQTCGWGKEQFWQGPVANATVFFSEVGEKLLEMFPEARFAAYYLDRNDGKRQWGIRARKDFDAATLIAKPMGGGGHPQACGFTTPLQ